MTSTLPKTWTESTFGSLNNFSSKTISPQSHPLEEFELYSVPAFPSGEPEICQGKDIGSTKQIVHENSILVCKINPRINRVWEVSPSSGARQIASSEWIGFWNEGLNARFYQYYFRSNTFRSALCADVTGVGGSLTRAQPKKVATIAVPVAPINEQRRIADKLDRVLARVDAANEHLSRVAPLIKRFRQSVLAAAFKGKLTEEFRKQEELTPIDETVKQSPEIPRPNRYNSRTDAVIPGDFALSVNQSNMIAPDGWKWLPMVDVARMESGHTPSRSFPEYWHGNIPWIGIVDARLHHTSTIEDTIQHTNNLGLENSAARLLPEGTVCVSRTASVGYVVKMGKPMATSQDFVNWVCGPAVNPDWLKWLFVAEEAALYRFGKGSTHTTIYFPEWLSLHVALPSLEEQSEIVRRVEKLFAFADRLEERLSQAQAAVQKLTPALLAKAFRGELVPQDPNDEPASELLKKLQESRTESAKPSRARKLRTKKSP
jgi:restriction modification system DNA specificity domain protein